MHTVFSKGRKFTSVNHLDAALVQVEVVVRSRAGHALLLIGFLVEVVAHRALRLLTHLAFDETVLQANLRERSRDLKVLVRFDAHTCGENPCHVSSVRRSNGVELFAVPETALGNVGDAGCNIGGVAHLDGESLRILDLLNIVRLLVPILPDRVRDHQWSLLSTLQKAIVFGSLVKLDEADRDFVGHRLSVDTSGFEAIRHFVIVLCLESGV